MKLNSYVPILANASWYFLNIPGDARQFFIKDESVAHESDFESQA